MFSAKSHKPRLLCLSGNCTLEVQANTCSARGHLWSSFAIVALSIFPALIVLLSSRFGPGISPDSVAYVSAAGSFASGAGFTIYTGEALTVFPVGISWILSISERMGIDLEVSSVLLNAVCASSCVLLSYLLALRSLSTRALQFAVAAIVSASWSVVSVYSMLWSEPLFTTVVLLVLLAVLRAVRQQNFGWWHVLFIGTAASASTLLRFTGVALVPVVALGVFVAARRAGRMGPAVMALGAVTLSIIGLLYSVARNLNLGTQPLGERYSSSSDALEILRESAITLGLYAYPEGRPTRAIAGLLGLAIAALFAYGAFDGIKRRSMPVALLGTFVLTYFLVLLGGQFSSALDPINSRLTIPAFVPAVIVCAYGVQGLSRKLHRSPAVSHRKAAAIVVAAGVMIGASVAVNLMHSVDLARHSYAEGLGYNNETWRSSTLASTLLSLPSSGIAATDPAATYWVSGLMPVTQLPRRDRYWPESRTVASLSEIKAAVESGAIQYLIFFDRSETALSPNVLQDAGISMTLDGEFPDGALYRTRSAINDFS